MSGKRLAIIGNQAFSMINFRGSFIREAVARGHEVYALAPDYTEADRAVIRGLGATPLDHGLSRTGVNPFRDAVATFRLLRSLRDTRPDVVLAYSIKPVTFGIIAASLAGVPSRFAMIEGLGHVFMRATSLRHRAVRAAAALLYRISLRRVDRILFLNPDDKADFVAIGLAPERRSEVIGGIGVDLERLQPVPPVTDPVTFLFVGRLLREKGIVEFVDAARTVRSNFPQARFILLGDVDSNPSSLKRAEIDAWVAEGIVTWPGHVAVEPWLAKASVFVLPSYREGVPRSTQEAMAMARPVITTDVPGCRETVVDGDNGYLVPAGDASALAEAMLRFAREPRLVAAMGQRSREIAEDLFDVRIANARLMERLGLT